MSVVPVIGTIPTTSTEYVKVPVSAFDEGLPVDPTSLVVNFATTEGAVPSGGDWFAGEWETANETYLALGLVGPFAAAGEYVVWVRVDATPERPVRKVGRLIVEA